MLRLPPTPSGRQPLLFFCVVALCVSISNCGWAQTNRASQSGSGSKAFEKQFWKYLIGNNYKNWAPGPGQSTNFYKGQAPHGHFVKVYMNRTAAGTIGDLGLGSVVILENYSQDRSLTSISVMYRTTDFNPEAKDWYWIEYQPDGSVAAASPEQGVHNVSLKPETAVAFSGKATQCIQCHQSAGASDFLFCNDHLDLAKTIEQPVVSAPQPATESATEPESQRFPEDEFIEADFVADAETETEDFFGTR